MNITPNERLLSLLLQAMDATILPELQSANAKAIGNIVQSVLADLLKREGTTAALVQRCQADGQALAMEMEALLDAPPRIAPASAATLAESIQQHADTTRRLSTLSEQLVAARRTQSLSQPQAKISELLLKAGNWELSYYQQQQAPAVAPAAAAKQASQRLTPETLTAFLQAVHPDGAAVHISGFEAIPGGFGKQTSRFTLHDAAGGTQELIARKNDPHPLLDCECYILASEFHLVKTLSAIGYLAPQPLWLGSGVDGVDADFYVMQRMPGKVPGSFLGGMQGSDGQDMLLDVATLLGQLHAYPLETFADYIHACDAPSLPSETVEACYRRQLAQWRRYAARQQQMHSPFLHFLIDWLERHVPADTRRPVLLHGDFNIHNLLVENGRVSGVLDWECAMFGAPEQELAYIQPHVSQHIAWDAFVARYLASGGREPQASNMPFYLAFSALRLHIAMLRATRHLHGGINDDIRYAMVELGFAPHFMNMAMNGTKAFTKL